MYIYIFKYIDILDRNTKTNGFSDLASTCLAAHVPKWLMIIPIKRPDLGFVFPKNPSLHGLIHGGSAPTYCSPKQADS